MLISIVKNMIVNIQAISLAFILSIVNHRIIKNYLNGRSILMKSLKFIDSI